MAIGSFVAGLSWGLVVLCGLALCLIPFMKLKGTILTLDVIIGPGKAIMLAYIIAVVSYLAGAYYG
jgi:hypothetical protein